MSGVWTDRCHAVVNAHNNIVVENRKAEPSGFDTASVSNHDVCKKLFFNEPLPCLTKANIKKPRLFFVFLGLTVGMKLLYFC